LTVITIVDPRKRGAFGVHHQWSSLVNMAGLKGCIASSWVFGL
jgi:hypothetical protein